MRRVNSVREALSAIAFSEDDEPENADANVICEHISLLEVTNFLEEHVAWVSNQI